jgi:transcriptional regulator with XRE-family HTH domain
LPPNCPVNRDHLKVSRSYLSQLEKGAFYASLKILEKLAKALRVEAYELIACFGNIRTPISVIRGQRFQ